MPWMRTYVRGTFHFDGLLSSVYHCSSRELYFLSACVLGCVRRALRRPIADRETRFHAIRFPGSRRPPEHLSTMKRASHRIPSRYPTRRSRAPTRRVVSSAERVARSGGANEPCRRKNCRAAIKAAVAFNNFTVRQIATFLPRRDAAGQRVNKRASSFTDSPGRPRMRWNEPERDDITDLISASLPGGSEMKKKIYRRDLGKLPDFCIRWLLTFFLIPCINMTLINNWLLNAKKKDLEAINVTVLSSWYINL